MLVFGLLLKRKVALDSPVESVLDSDFDLLESPVVDVAFEMVSRQRVWFSCSRMVAGFPVEGSVLVLPLQTPLSFRSQLSMVD